MRPIIEASILKRNSLHNHNTQRMPCDLTGDLKILPAVDDSAAVFAMESSAVEIGGDKTVGRTTGSCQVASVE